MITAQLATVPGRIDAVKLTIKSLLPQVDELYIMLNDYPSGIYYQLMQEYDTTGGLYLEFRNNQMGDAEKMFNIEEREGYIFTCDDDLIYPPDYCQRMIDKIEQYDRRAVITLHGRNYTPGKIERYYGSRNRTERYHCLEQVLQDHPVTIGGTGVMAWHSDTVKVCYEDFKAPNMADLWMAIVCRQQSVPIIVAEHDKRWLRVGYDGEDNIWNKHFNDDAYQTMIYNEYLAR